MGGCALCLCPNTLITLKSTLGLPPQVGTIPLANGITGCPTLDVYKNFGFDEHPRFDYAFSSQTDAATYTLELTNKDVPFNVTLVFEINDDGLPAVIRRPTATPNTIITDTYFAGALVLGFYFTIPKAGFGTLKFCFRISLESDGNFLLQTFTCASSSVGLPQPPVLGPRPPLPLIAGEALPTKDGNQICSLKYVVTTSNDGSDIKVKTYQFYCKDLDITKVTKGQGCTVTQKVDFWTSQGFSIDFEIFVQYALLRTILSQQLYGCFNLQFLRQRYYNTFKKDLNKSEFARYLVFFKDPSFGVTHYDRFFKE